MAASSVEQPNGVGRAPHPASQLAHPVRQAQPASGSGHVMKNSRDGRRLIAADPQRRFQGRRLCSGKRADLKFTVQRQAGSTLESD